MDISSFVYSGFQSIVDAYGTATYREANPGLFTCITFPFLFAVMFGDIGHGFIMALFGAYLVLNEKKFAGAKGEMWGMVFGGRYMVLMMGCFSMFTGFMYNDIFSLPMDWFKTGWEEVKGGDEKMELFEKRWTYAFGIDPVSYYLFIFYHLTIEKTWHHADNSLIFLNSYKMKMAITLGVMHMTLGIVMNIFNHRHFKRPLYILFETLPQLLFLHSMFGYLVCIILYKWVSNWDGRSAPGLLNTLIYMFLSPGNVKESEQLYPGQVSFRSNVMNRV